MPRAKAAVAVLRGRDGLFLAVSRREDPRDLNFPGGWVEPGETPRQAAARELREETGYEVRVVRELWSSGSTVAFEVQLANQRKGRPRRGEVGAVAWVPRRVLEAGSFGSAVKPILARLTS